MRVAAAAQTVGRDPAMRVAFRTGGFVGMVTVGLGLLGASLVVLIYKSDAPTVLEGFGFGAALLAMFMRVGGGIFTKAADVGADLVGKVEQNIPEDDPRNAATIADNVGDNVGDCAGMAADLFESYAVTLVAALILGKAAFGARGPRLPADRPRHRRAHRDRRRLSSPKPREGEGGLTTINRAFYISAAISAVLCTIAAFLYLPGTFDELDHGTSSNGRLERLLAAISGRADGDPRSSRLVAVVIGIVLAALILALTGYFTGTEHRPVKDVGKTSLTGAATVILSGLSVGFESAVYTALVIAAAVYGAFLLGGGSVVVSLFAVALAGCGLLTTVGVIVAMDTFGPVSDNAQGIAEMSGDVDERGRGDPHRARRGRQHHQGDHQGHRDRHGRARGDRAVRLVHRRCHAGRGRCAARSRGRPELHRRCCRCSACSTSRTRPTWSVCSSAPRSCSCSPVWRSTPSAGPLERWCSRCAASSARSPGSWRAPVVRSTARSSTSARATRCASWPRRACWRSWPRSRSASVSAPPRSAAYLAGAIGTGTLMAVFLANSGGAWDNAKKLVEDGNHGGKGSPAHEATIIGDTVGDPFKDTAGPAINPLLKVMNLVSLLIAPAVITLSVGDDQNDRSADR